MSKHDTSTRSETPSVRWALVTLVLAMLLSSLGTSIANVALPTLSAHFDGSFQAVQWVVLAYLLAVTTSIVGVGKIGDATGRRRLLRVGLLLFAGASLVGGVAPALWVLIAARAVQGLGAAIMMALAIAFVGELVPKNETGRAMGLLGTTSAIGTALGPSLGGLLIDQVGWQAIFLLNLPLSAVAFVLAKRHLPADPRTERTDRAGFDVAGTLLLALMLASYALAMTIGRGELGTASVALLAGAALAAGLFVAVESRAASPLIRPSMFRDAALSASLAANLLVSTVLMATLVIGPFHLSISLGLEPGAVGLVMSIGPAVAAATGLPAGWLVDRLGSRRTTLAGLLGIALGSLALSVTPESLGVVGYVVPIVAVTAGYALFQAANNTAVMKDVSSDQRGVVSGLLSLSRNLGLVTGASLMGAVFALASGTDDVTAASPSAVAAGMRATFGVAGALVVMALVLVVGGRALAARRLAGLVAGALVLASLAGVAAAQEIPSDQRGFVLRSADGANSLRVMGLLQLQYAHDRTSASDETDALFVHRARIGLLGSVFMRDLRYMLVTELRGDVRLLFAHLDYTLVPDWLTVRVGQFKRPFSRSFITFASQLSMIDRPLTIGPHAFGDAVDVGVMLHDGTSGHFEYAVGVFAGGGLAALSDRVHPLVSVRLGYDTDDMIGYSESDLEGGAPRFGIAVAGMADFGGHGEHDSFVSATADLMFKAYGLSLTSAFYVGGRQREASGSNLRYGAIGHYTQLGYVIAGVVEPVVRYSLMIPARDAAQHDVAGGLDVYFQGHALKLQSFVTVRFEDTRDRPDVRFQAQLSMSL